MMDQDDVRVGVPSDRFGNPGSGSTRLSGQKNVRWRKVEHVDAKVVVLVVRDHRGILAQTQVVNGILA